MDKIVFKNKDGSIGIITPTEESLKHMSIEDIAKKDVPDGLGFRITDESNIPSDRHFREAWTDTTVEESIDIDIEKAREIQKEYIRDARKPIMESLDIEQMKGVDVAAKKQELRDFTNKVEGVEDLDTLREILPKGD